ncbi:hypothetical protein TWF481_004462 [Arthrobotrys musiformis]|uniref:Uncharacterized protein n=1 Tax=Arthrobotrys musiformis TaxID=47236 RepID=A0AAV9WLQ6_9PEZI
MEIPHFIHEIATDFVEFLWWAWTRDESVPAGAGDLFYSDPAPMATEFVGDYAGSYKNTAFFIGPGGQNLPTVVLETGFLESAVNSTNDKDMWFQGTGGVTRVVIFINTIRGDGGYAVFLEVWTRRGYQRARVYPRLVEGESDPVLDISDLWGAVPVPAGYGGNQLTLSREDLKGCLTKVA